LTLNEYSAILNDMKQKKTKYQKQVLKRRAGLQDVIDFSTKNNNPYFSGY
jgi:hypothetical protein